MDRSKLMGEEKITRLLLKFSIPAIIGMIVNALYNVVDRIFIGQGVGSLAIAGITMSFPIMMIGMGFGMLIGIGANSLISIRLGEQKKAEAELIMGNSLVLLILISLILSIAGLIFIKPLLLMFGTSKNALPYAIDYLTIILYGNIFMGVGFGMSHFIRAEGNPKIAMWTMAIGAIVNTILDTLFIFGFGWGIKGAAWATVISQMVSGACVILYYLTGKSLLRFHRKNFKLQPAVVGKILSIGSAPFAMQVAASFLHMLLNSNLTKYGGDVAVAAIGIVNSIMMLFMMPVFGINQGSQPIIGYNYGAKKFDRVIQSLKLSIFAATVVVSLGYILIRIYPHQFIALFNNNDTELINLGAKSMTTFLFFMPIIGFQIVGANYFQAIGKPKHALLLSLSRQVLILIPLLLILPKYFALQGVLIAPPIADLTSSLITGTFLFFELKRLEEKHQRKFQMEPQLE